QLYNSLNDDLARLVALNVQGGKDASAHADSAFAHSRRLILGAVVVALLLALGVGIYLARSISRQVGKVAMAARELAGGDLKHDVEVRSNDEIGDMAEAFRAMTAGLREVVSELQQAAHSLSSASNEILAATTEQGASTTEQAAAVSETTATVDE